MPASDSKSTRPSNPKMITLMRVTIELDERLMRMIGQLENADLGSLSDADKAALASVADQLSSAQDAIRHPLGVARAGQDPNPMDVLRAKSAVETAEGSMSDVLRRLTAIEGRLDGHDAQFADLPKTFANKAWVEEQFSGAKNYIDDTRNIALEARAMASVQGGRAGIIAGLVAFVVVTLIVWGGLSLGDNEYPLRWGLVWGGFVGGFVGLIVSLVIGGRARAHAHARSGDQQVDDQAEDNGSGASGNANVGSGTTPRANAGTRQ